MSTRTVARVGTAVVPDAERAARWLTALAAVAVAARFAGTLALNAPGVIVSHTVEPTAAAATVVAALGAVALALAATDARGRFGLLFVGVFGLLSAVTPAVTVPAVAAVAGGTAVVAASYAGHRTDAERVGIALLVTGLAVGLGSGVGDLAWLRPAATAVTLAGVAATPVFVATDAGSLASGAAAAALLVAVAVSVPFLTGAASLVTLGAVGVGPLLLGAAAAGAVTATSAAVRQRRAGLVCGVALVALAGVPVTLARAVPFALGVAVLASPEVEG